MNRQPRTRAALSGAALFGSLLFGCTTAGSTWMAQPLPGSEESFPEERSAYATAPVRRPAPRQEARVLSEDSTSPREVAARAAPMKLEGRVLEGFRNTYYDFPAEAEFTGETVSLKDAQCRTIRGVPRGFYEAVCVQGSGTLQSGKTVSFAKRDCECAEVCAKTQQKICFDELDARQYPWGRGATGQAITPLLTVAVDSDVIPLHTPIYIPEYDGLPRDGSQSAFHDGCFIAQDRGLRVKGQHVDIFTGETALTRLWNQMVPSNRGVTLVLDSPRCARATDAKPLAREAK
ncbi:MAG TPA: 3D domain-containing protein [Polyangiaceae bacterium]|nr:3D domain-containing protein [Polyangiaceae bacterium]